MIIYKLNEINERIEEMRSNIKKIIKDGEKVFYKDIENYRSEKQQVENNKDLTDTGKNNMKREVSNKYYNKYVSKGKLIIDDIAAEYDKAIARVKELKNMDDEKKIINYDNAKDTDVIKENTNLMYAIQILNSIDENQGHEQLKTLFDSNQGSEKILTLIKMKVDRLKKTGAESNEINEVSNAIKQLDVDYISKIEYEKMQDIDYYERTEYPRTITRNTIKDIFEVSAAEQSKFFAN